MPICCFKPLSLWQCVRVEIRYKYVMEEIVLASKIFMCKICAQEGVLFMHMALKQQSARID